jgi:broad specificity phosphatase PhoE
MFNILKDLLKPKEAHVLMVRHGSTDLNKQGGDSEDRIRGWLDVKLNNQGIKDADSAKEKLEAECSKVDYIYCSDLTRTKQTAEIINQDFKAPIKYTSNLRPWNLGSLSGKLTKDVMPIMEALIKSPDQPAPDGESFNQFKRRLLPYMNKVIKHTNDNKLTVVCVTHYRDVKMMQAWIEAGMGDDLKVDGEVLNTDNCEPGDVYELPLK